MEPKGQFFFKNVTDFGLPQAYKCRISKRKITGWIQKPFAQCFISSFLQFFTVSAPQFFTPFFTVFFFNFLQFFTKPGLATEMAGDFGAT